jgi:hypothetical protein
MMLTEAQTRRKFATYYLDLRDAQKRDGATAPPKAQEWEYFINHLLEESEVPPVATTWKCPRSLEAELKK